jgi:sterol desaturase/sphingolipid hydroxylase (fatty acid hydroxylase superfamily)
MKGLWVTTEYHHWHHVADQEIRNRNYAGALPVFDWLFGTYYLPKDKLPDGYGIDTPMPNSYLGQLTQPFR